jgi:hypothetical protein
MAGIKAKAKKIKDLLTMTEEEIFQLAVKSYRKNKISLSLSHHKVKIVSDKYYWAYLANDDQTDDGIFYNTMEIEMFRRKIIPKLDLIPLSGFKFELSNRPNNVLDSRYYTGENGKFKDNNPDIRYDRIISNTRFYSECIGPKGKYINSLENLEIKHVSMLADSNAGFQKGLKLYPPKFISLLEDISKMGGIIAGGFVSGLINQIYYLIRVDEIGVNFNYNSDVKESVPYEGNDINHIFSPDIYPVIDGPDELNPTVIPGFGMLIMVFMSRYLKEDEAYPYSNGEPVHECRRRYSDYNLEKGLEDLQDYVYIRNNIFYRKLFKKSPDVDIFVTDMEVADRIVELLLNFCQNIPNSKFICTEFSTTFSFGSYWPKIQIIKRVYNSPDEILGGFDLDPSRAALLWQGDKFEAFCTNSYINAVEFGINLIVPSRQSESFNHRIAKYSAKGFEPYFPGLKLGKIYSKGKKIVHSAKYLLRHFTTEDHKWGIKKASDYDKVVIKSMGKEGKKLEGIARDKRLNLIKKGKLQAEATDVFQLANKLLRDISILNQEGVKDTKLDYFIVKILSVINWRTIEPGSQITGSFNPTKIDYLAGIVREVEEEKKTPNGNVLIHIPSDLANIVDSYTEVNYNYIISFLFKIRNNMKAKKNFRKDYGLTLLDRYEHGRDA